MERIDGNVYIRLGRCTGLPVASEEKWDASTDDERRSLVLIALAFGIYNAIQSGKGWPIN